ncbi:MAG TPA: sugar transferase [Stellaceae bacterium]|nr:sugar transferase [Stellaceae bacterium]
MTSLRRIRSQDAESNYSYGSPFSPGWQPQVFEGGLAPRPLTAKLPKLRRRKRLFDLVVGSALLVFLAPLMAVIAALLKLDGGPAVFGHRRVGADGRSFRCWKFRSMVPNADEVLTKILESDPAARAEWDRDFKLRADPRITRVGRFLRVTSLDELPQLFNVLAGEMSLIGPRPIVAEEVARYGDAYRYYCACRPGMTGMWQVSGRNRVDYRRRVAYDQQYATNWSLLLDLSVLCRTVVVVTSRNGAY